MDYQYSYLSWENDVVFNFLESFYVVASMTAYITNMTINKTLLEGENIAVW